MEAGRTTKLEMPSIQQFDFQIKYTETDRRKHWHEIDLHTHKEFELYINLSGDVSFLVENTLYPLTRGDVIIARPNERHHCVYRSDKTHRLFWILFDCEKNRQLLDFLTPDFSGNYISPQGSLREELLEICCALHGNRLSREAQLYSFFRIFAILKSSRSAISLPKEAGTEELREIIDYINSHIHEEITVAHMAKELFISQSTLERKFRKALDIRPLEFIRRKKLILAAQLLQEGKSVLQAGADVGYNDNSYFIELFKRYYGTTPYQYQKQVGAGKDLPHTRKL